MMLWGVAHFAVLGSAPGQIAAVAVVLGVLIGTVVTIRDKLLDAGLNKPRWLIRSHQRAAARRVTKDIAFLESEFFEHVGNATDVAVARKKHPDGALDHPDRKLIEALKECTISLGDSTDFYGLRHYVDTMGAISSSEAKAARFATIAHAWLTALQDRNAITPFDCILSIKDGNPILVHTLAQRMHRSDDRSVRAVFCKGAHDSARVSTRHETDFEGLSSFKRQQVPRCHRLRAIAVDDNCATGKSLVEGIERFNGFVAEHPEEYPFEPVTAAVVLFLVKTGKPTAFDDSSIALHALLALGDREMSKICQTSLRKLKREVDDFKDSPACKWSSTLEDAAIADGATS